MKHIVEKPAASDAEDEASDAEAKAAMFIKAKCEAGELFAARLSDPAEDYAVQFTYYERIRDACIACVDKLNESSTGASPFTRSSRCALPRMTWPSAGPSS